MGLWQRTLEAVGLQQRDLASDAIGWHDRSGRRVGNNSQVSPESALRHSAVWACLRLRADLISSMPIDVFRRIGDVLVEVNKPGWLVTPSPDVDITEWMWATQFDLDRYGNAFGLITMKDSAGRPAEIELMPAGEVTILTKGRRISGYRVGTEVLDPSLIWHERQYVAAGSPMGMSPIAFAAMSIGGYLSAQQFALDWYTTGAQPSGVLRNTQRTVPQETANAMKARFKVATEGRDVFVTGNDWEWSPTAGDANSAAFIDEMKWGVGDVCRYLGVPGDMIDAPVDGSAVTYANVTQRNLQLLVINVGPAVVRRERRLSGALANPRIVKLNSDALLRMDPQTRAAVLAGQVAAKLRTPTEARGYDNLGPYTEDQLAEFDRFWPTKQVATAPEQRALGWAPPDARSPQNLILQGYATDLPDLPAAIESGVPIERAPR